MFESLMPARPSAPSRGRWVQATDLVDASHVVGTVPVMATRNHVDHSTTLTFNFDRSYHWAWVDQARSRLADPRDQDSYDECVRRGLRMHPEQVLRRLEHALMFVSDQIVDLNQWREVILFVAWHVQTRRRESLEHFVAAIEADFCLRGGQPRSVMVTVVDAADGSACTLTEFSIDQVFSWFNLEDEEFAAMTYSHDGESSFARLTLTGPGRCEAFELHFASDPLREYLARHHVRTVVDGVESIIAHLNAASDEHCRRLHALTLAEPHDELWVLERRLARDDTRPS